MNQSIRIIGGRYRGKKLGFPDLPQLRPTPNRVRETLFNWLQNDIQHARCLDAFAGSGALGLEAFSRGADNVIFIEQHHLAYTHLQTCIHCFESSNLQLIQGDGLLFIQQHQTPFDIIFLDPPFHSDLLITCLNLLHSSPVLHPDGLVYFESSSDLSFDPLYWDLLKKKNTGQVVYGLLKKHQNR